MYWHSSCLVRLHIHLDVMDHEILTSSTDLAAAIESKSANQERRRLEESTKRFYRDDSIETIEWSRIGNLGEIITNAPLPLRSRLVYHCRLPSPVDRTTVEGSSGSSKLPTDGLPTQNNIYLSKGSGQSLSSAPKASWGGRGPMRLGSGRGYSRSTGNPWKLEGRG